jgi:hypothetical protein
VRLDHLLSKESPPTCWSLPANCRRICTSCSDQHCLMEIPSWSTGGCLIVSTWLIVMSRRLRPDRVPINQGVSDDLVLCSAAKERCRAPTSFGSGRLVLFAPCSPSSSVLRSIWAWHLENCIASTSIENRPVRLHQDVERGVVFSNLSIEEDPSYKEPMVNALASTTDEGRDWLRNATGSCLVSFDPWISEWGNPTPLIGCYSRLNT